ncbi:MAG: hypothetical protein BWY93_01391 [Euryarchaeota archaeon ADurb.BinA087]|nr:MAG: hypothetical protein BWY93_01391 [Euryarchaeota archaeon ADurb.BinA087]
MDSFISFTVCRRESSRELFTATNPWVTRLAEDGDIPFIRSISGVKDGSEVVVKAFEDPDDEVLFTGVKPSVSRFARE